MQQLSYTMLQQQAGDALLLPAGGACSKHALRQQHEAVMRSCDGRWRVLVQAWHWKS